VWGLVKAGTLRTQALRFAPSRPLIMHTAPPHPHPHPPSGGAAYDLNLAVFKDLSCSITGLRGRGTGGAVGWGGGSWAAAGVGAWPAPRSAAPGQRSRGSRQVLTRPSDLRPPQPPLRPPGWPGGKPGADDGARPERAAPHPKRVLLFSPHPDDDVISMGGTLHRLVGFGGWGGVGWGGVG
jgi:hypothetical protein